MPENNFMKRIVALSLLIILLMFAGVSAASAEMLKIAVASDGQTATTAVGSAAARSSFFLIFDGDGKFVEAISNPHKDARSGAGSLVAKFLAQKGVQTAAAQTFGGKMVDAMKSVGVSYFESKGSADDAVKKYLNSIASKKP